jgi:hypothetical protein
VGVVVLRPLAVLFVLQGLLGIVLQSRAAVLNRVAFVLYLGTLLVSFWVQLWEFLGKTSTSAQERAANRLSTLSAMSSSPTTYAELSGDGGFDWHAATTRPAAFFFLDVASFSCILFTLLFIGTLLIVAVLCAAFKGVFGN